MKTIYQLTKISVTVITDTGAEQHAKCYVNDEFGRTVLQKEVQEPLLSEILAVWGDAPTVQPPVVDIEDIRRSILSSISAACNQAITAGFDLPLSNSETKHFSLQETDQINISTALAAVQQGAAEYPYHADAEMCRLFSAQEIMALAKAAAAHKLYHTTYCSHLLAWARRAENPEALECICYGAPLPEDLAVHMQAVMTAMQGDSAV